MAYEIDKRLTEFIVRELPLNRRQQLSSYLNSEQVLMAECGLARDYRGLAQQLDLSYSEIAQLEKYCDPCGSLLGDHRVAKLSVYDLFELLVSIGRYDILDDMIPVLVQELTTLNQQRSRNDKNELTRVIPDQNTIWYDAYVCYADSDIDFVRRLAEYLESPEVGFRLFIRDRDLLGGHWAYETFARLIETQCRRMIIILSPEFLQSHDCKFQSLFATGLAIEKCSRILVPIIYKPCSNLPSMLRLMSKIDMSHNSNKNIPEWSMKRLIMSIREQQCNIAGDDTNRPSAIEYPKNINNDNSKPNHKPELIQTTISVISNTSSECDDDSTRPLLVTRPVISNPEGNNTATTATVNDNTQLSTNSNTTSKKWIKNIKKKIKVSF